jgi:hypothetical protein
LKENVNAAVRCHLTNIDLPLKDCCINLILAGVMDGGSLIKEAAKDVISGMKEKSGLMN